MRNKHFAIRNIAAINISVNISLVLFSWMYFKGKSLDIRLWSKRAISLLITFQLLISSVQLLSRVWLFATPWTTAGQALLSFTISWNLLKFTSTELMMPSNHLILWCPILLLCSIFPSIRVFSSESPACIRWPKYWSFSFSISPFHEYSGLISFRIDRFDQSKGLFKSLLQHYTSVKF